MRKTTSIKVDEELWKKVKIECIQIGKDVSDFIEELLREKLKNGKR